jgi:copper chaperone CopZ|tara:strand:+ start:926 stop:1555 length:630 start_codon:yes stop_codon:yes gene_type:complete
MTCEGCSNRVRNVLEGVKGVSSADVNHLDGVAMIDHEGVSKDLLSGAIRSIGYSVDGQSEEFHWSDRSVWRRAANNTKWCLVGCAIGEFGTLAYYSYSGITADLELYSRTWYFFAILPLINGLATSVMLETFLLIRGQMDFRSALSTALGMSFISMLMMEISMEFTDLLFTKGELGLNYAAVPLMLIVGFLTPWPYNYWRLKKYGMACH